MEDEGGPLVNFTSSGTAAPSKRRANENASHPVPKKAKLRGASRERPAGTNQKEKRKSTVSNGQSAIRFQPKAAGQSATKFQPKTAGQSAIKFQPKTAGQTGKKNSQESSRPMEVISSLFTYNPTIEPSKAVSQAETTTNQNDSNSGEDLNAVNEVPDNQNADIKQPSNDEVTFESLGLRQRLCQCLERKLSITRPTPIQQAAIPVLLEGKDVLVQSATGSGKTLVYVLPILHSLSELPVSLTRADGVQAVVLTPTREIAKQVYDVLQMLTNACPWIVPGCVIGGEKKKAEKARIRKGITVLVATPGRLADHLMTTMALNLAYTRWLVCDEADRLLDFGFEKDLTTIIQAMNGHHLKYQSKEDAEDTTSANQSTEDSNQDSTQHTRMPTRTNNQSGETSIMPAKLVWDRHGPSQGKEPLRRQSVMVSATMTDAVQRLSRLSLVDPVWVVESATKPDNNQSEGTTFDTPQHLTQLYVCVPSKLRLVTLAAFLRSKCVQTANSPPRKAVVFMLACDIVDFHYALWKNRKDLFGDLPFFALHGNMDQSQRTATVKAFGAAQGGVLLATDLAARGLDLPDVNWIVQHSVPQETSAYVHRVGRTARVGRKGKALLFLLPSEIDYLEHIAKSGVKMRPIELNGILKTLVPPAKASEKKSKPMKSVVEDAATEVQLSFEEAVRTNSALARLARQAHIGYLRGYTTYPKALKGTFNVHQLHTGHVAKAFALREPPTTIYQHMQGKSQADQSEHGENSTGRKKGNGKSEKSDVGGPVKKARGGTSVTAGLRVDSKRSTVPSLFKIDRDKYKRMPIGGGQK